MQDAAAERAEFEAARAARREEMHDREKRIKDSGDKERWADLLKVDDIERSEQRRRERQEEAKARPIPRTPRPELWPSSTWPQIFNLPKVVRELRDQRPEEFALLVRFCNAEPPSQLFDRYRLTRNDVMAWMRTQGQGARA